MEGQAVVVVAEGDEAGVGEEEGFDEGDWLVSRLLVPRGCGALSSLWPWRHAAWMANLSSMSILCRV